MTDLGLKGIDFYQKEIFELKNNYIHYLPPFFSHAEKGWWETIYLWKGVYLTSCLLHSKLRNFVIE